MPKLTLRNIGLFVVIPVVLALAVSQGSQQPASDTNSVRPPQNTTKPLGAITEADLKTAAMQCLTLRFGGNAVLTYSEMTNHTGNPVFTFMHILPNGNQERCLVRTTGSSLQDRTCEIECI